MGDAFVTSLELHAQAGYAQRRFDPEGVARTLIEDRDASASVLAVIPQRMGKSWLVVTSYAVSWVTKKVGGYRIHQRVLIRDVTEVTTLIGRAPDHFSYSVLVKTSTGLMEFFLGIAMNPLYGQNAYYGKSQLDVARQASDNDSLRAHAARAEEAVDRARNMYGLARQAQRAAIPAGAGPARSATRSASPVDSNSNTARQPSKAPPTDAQLAYHEIAPTVTKSEVRRLFYSGDPLLARRVDVVNRRFNSDRQRLRRATQELIEVLWQQFGPAFTFDDALTLMGLPSDPQYFEERHGLGAATMQTVAEFPEGTTHGLDTADVVDISLYHEYIAFLVTLLARHRVRTSA